MACPWISGGRPVPSSSLNLWYSKLTGAPISIAGLWISLAVLDFCLARRVFDKWIKLTAATANKIEKQPIAMPDISPALRVFDADELGVGELEGLLDRSLAYPPVGLLEGSLEIMLEDLLEETDARQWSSIP